jgi:hypothetical protein
MTEPTTLPGEKTEVDVSTVSDADLDSMLAEQQTGPPPEREFFSVTDEVRPSPLDPLLSQPPLSEAPENAINRA